MTNRPAKLAAALLLLLAGAALWWFFGQREELTQPGRIVWLLLSLVAALASPIRRVIAAQLQRLRYPSDRARCLTGIAAGVFAALYIILSAHQQGRQFIPRFHDEHMHMLQMQHLAHMRLWMPQHPLADFFESFHIFVKPVYASVYFPGASLMYVPAVWLGLPAWLGPVIASGAVVGLLYRVVTELIDGVAGLLAAVMTLGLLWFRYLALIVMSHTNMALLGLLLIWAYLHWRRTNARHWAWTAAIGALAGWAAITRPVDAICYAAPVGVAMLLDLRRFPWNRRALTITLIVACACPFLALQLVQNIGVTGQWLKTPYRLYADDFTPQMSFGFHHFDPTIRPKTNLPQRRFYYEKFTIPAAQAHRPNLILRQWLDERLPTLIESSLPATMLIVLLPACVFALGHRRWVLVAVLPLYLAMYSLLSYLLQAYVVVVAPAIIFAVLLGKHAIERLSPRTFDALTTFLTLEVLGLALCGYPQINAAAIDEAFVHETPSVSFSYLQLPQLVRQPAIVLFHYEIGDFVHGEPVYNVDVPWPDDAPIIRAHDLGPQRNRLLFDYYAKRQPQRTVYLYDRTKGVLTLLGNVADLSHRFPLNATQPTTAPAR